MAMWNPWKGCKKCSDGCRYCYIYKGNAKRGVDTSIIEKTKDFAKPTERLKNGNYKMKSGIVYLPFTVQYDAAGRQNLKPNTADVPVCRKAP